MNCKNCGRSLNDGAKFCPGCGQKVESQAPKAASTEELQKKPPLVPILAVVLALAVLLGGWYILNRQAASSSESAHDFTYVTPSGTEYTGTYTGDWSNGQPNGDGEFSGKGEDGSISLVGTWSNGKPNGQCRRILTTDTYTQTYSGDYFYGELRGNGSWKIEDSNGNLTKTYTGEFRDDQRNGSGEITYYYTDEEAAENGYDRRVYKGQFANDAWSGAGELTIYYTAEYAASSGIERLVYTGQYSDGWTGEVEQVIYCTSAYADEHDFDTLVEPYRYACYQNGKVVEEGRVRDGKHISDAAKAGDDALYDAARSLFGDGFWGDIFDLVMPAFYDRNAE